jgi:hypothetical protein
VRDHAAWIRGAESAHRNIVAAPRGPPPKHEQTFNAPLMKRDMICIRSAAGIRTELFLAAHCDGRLMARNCRSALATQQRFSILCAMSSDDAGEVSSLSRRRDGPSG